ncbi:MAG: HPr family phosphocarrier protein [Blautia sp.]|nr:HPr family phosphocarrier protein [Blautia sp.]
MKKVMVYLKSINRAKKFVDTISKFDCDFRLVANKLEIDPKSIMAVLSLDISKEIELDIFAEGDQLEEILAVIRDYQVDEPESDPS